MKRVLFLLLFVSLTAQGADKVKIGFISTLSGPNASIGSDIRDAFNLAVKLNGGKLGGLPAEVLVSDDQLKPENAKQIAERYLQKDKVDFITGIVFSNVVMAVAPDAISSKVFFISPNAGPAPFTGAQCNPFFFAASWPSEAYSEAGGQYMTSKGIKNAIFLAPNYVGGHDAATGFKRYYKGKLVEEMYTKLGQLDYAAELSQIRAAKPEALYVFLPGGMGINFIKQFVASGMSRDIQLIVPLWGSDQDIIRAVGDPMLGLFSVGHWSIDFDNPANKKFVAEFEKEYKRLPTGYAATGLRHGDADRLGDPQGEGQDRGQERAARRAPLRGLQERARRLQVRQEPVPGAELLPAAGGQGPRRPHRAQDHGHSADRAGRCLRAGLQDAIKKGPRGPFLL
jgi:branched-chain amino acid transport system substrate-binding protein